MSHWTKGKVSINRPDLFKGTCEKRGLQVTTGKGLVLHSNYAGDVNVDMLITDPITGDTAGLVRDKDGSLIVQMDNWGNSLAYNYGDNLADIVQDYAAEVVKLQAVDMGAVVVEEATLDNGDIELRLEVV